MKYRKARKPTSTGRIEQNKIARMAEERKQRQQVLIHSMQKLATERIVSETFGVMEALCELEEDRRFAMVSDPPQASAMVAATVAKMRLMGLLIDRQAIGKPEDFEMSPAQRVQALRDEIGEAAWARVTAMYKAVTGRTIDVDAEGIEEGPDDEEA
jgi:hypothetical protein